MVASATGSRQRLESEVVGHALADVRAEILDAHGAVEVHDLQADPRLHVGDVAGDFLLVGIAALSRSAEQDHGFRDEDPTLRLLRGSGIGSTIYRKSLLENDQTRA